jgi:hypothetical protein
MPIQTTYAERLLSALARARQGSGTPQPIAELRQEAGLGEETYLELTCL